jgi:hypothetical protein
MPQSSVVLLSRACRALDLLLAAIVVVALF